jgi:hypothetical protein
VGSQEWAGSGRVLKERPDIGTTAVDTTATATATAATYCYLLLYVTRGGIGEIVSLSPAQGCAQNCDDDAAPAVFRYQRWFESGTAESGDGRRIRRNASVVV